MTQYEPIPTMPTADHAALQLRREVADITGMVRSAVRLCERLGPTGLSVLLELDQVLLDLEAMRPDVDRMAGEAYARMVG